MRSIANIGCVAVLLLAGCASPYDIVPGRSSAQEVRALIGPPWRTTHLDRQQRDVWIYNIADSIGTPHVLSVQMSADGVVRELVRVRDPALDKP